MSDRSAESMPESRTSGRPGLVLLGVGIASFIGCLDLTIVNTALPVIRLGLGMDVQSGQWSMTAFLLALSGFMVLAGRCADAFGQARVLYIGLAIFAASSLAAGLAPSAGAFIGARFAQGAGCAVLYTVSAAIVSAAYLPERRGWALGQLFGINGIGLALGPVAGGLIIELAGWRPIFLLNIPLLAVGAWLCATNLRLETPARAGGEVDVFGAVALFVTVTGCVLWLSDVPWSRALSGDGWALLAGRNVAASLAIVGGVLFVIAERRSRSPIVDFALFRSPRFVAAIAATVFLAFYYSEVLFLLPAWLTIDQGETAWQAGLMLLATTAPMTILSPLAGKLVDRIGVAPLLVGGLLLLAGSAWLQSNSVRTPSHITVLVALVLFGAGWAGLLGPSTTAAINAAPEGTQASATGVAWTLHNVGGAIGLAWLGHLAHREAGGHAAIAGIGLLYATAARVLAVLAIIAAIAIGLLLRQELYRPTRGGEDRASATQLKPKASEMLP